ncbi:MAG TPA: hypothetical protein VGF86_04080 [Candidatus Tumulicola sp.]|jgi:hypothetical protein
MFTAEARTMTRRFDVEKRREWVKRFERFRASGLTVAQFCAHEPVSENTFYYWAKRIGRHSTTARPSEQNGASERPREPKRRSRLSAPVTTSPLVHFRLNAGVEVSVPANCLDVIRCLLESIQPSSAERSDAFHEVVVNTR